ncbi:NAD dependent epimerase/dehydratase family protein [Metarhizium acridum CQMa 102]|uniref:NAD dependent epimerase/dehydratase family protein n=1 Tax=Metarhizium acridum (strain CQMa 102) TaxID=655827 RepID=E9EF51_METAQ|nr:NAD dependent epimerase/dehydratase family protein [Metarhizium acridum CQMa 102]EFY85434.1 NAD dependent epimerase/dehydratase family protein [Metarhizium acridum CQMa 102]
MLTNDSSVYIAPLTQNVHENLHFNQLRSKLKYQVLEKMKSQVFVVGPGYVGREIIDLLLSEGQYEITTLVRREAALEEFEKDGVKAVLGDLNDAKIIQQLSAKSDVIFHTATADHLESAQAILAGIEERAGQAGYVGSGKKAWGVVHVRDLAKAYVQVLHWIEEAEDSDPELQNPYFFCESGEVTWGEVSAIIGKGLYNAGRIATPETKSIPESDYGDLFGPFTPDVVGCNCRNRADRLRSMGWKPEQLGLEEAFEKEDLPALLSEKGEFKASEMTLS